MDRKKHEIWALCVLTISLLVLFSILSYHEKDPTIFNSSKESDQKLGRRLRGQHCLAADHLFWNGRLRAGDYRFVGKLASFQGTLIRTGVAPALGYRSSHREHNDSGRPALGHGRLSWARNSKPAEKSVESSLNFLTTVFRRWVRIRF